MCSPRTRSPPGQHLEHTRRAKPGGRDVRADIREFVPELRRGESIVREDLQWLGGDVVRAQEIAEDLQERALAVVPLAHEHEGDLVGIAALETVAEEALHGVPAPRIRENFFEELLEPGQSVPASYATGTAGC